MNEKFGIRRLSMSFKIMKNELNQTDLSWSRICRKQDRVDFSFENGELKKLVLINSIWSDENIWNDLKRFYDGSEA